ncbi:hypothetical protein [Bradyrhizobium japonicum]|uniref:hypothetical protein n=1 Tax=Bradyrhizobium japonicum TaxID=375 RepID=UPI000577CD2B|nr:hypothetical protein [Bradyrhizobium japonicum]
MTNDELISAIEGLALKTNADVGDARWYIFGSAQQRFSDAVDIDILVVCETDSAADAIRRTVDVDQFGRPLHLSILTQVEEAEVQFVQNQACTQVL